MGACGPCGGTGVQNCNICHGSGKRQGSEACGACDGSGRDKYHADDDSDDARSCNECYMGRVNVEKDCYCGSGVVICGVCNGEGDVDD